MHRLRQRFTRWHVPQPQTRHQKHGRIAHVLPKIGSAIHQPPELLVSHVIGAAAGGVDFGHFIGGLPVDRSESLALRLAAYDDEDPVLFVASGRSSYRGVENQCDQIFRHWDRASAAVVRAPCSRPQRVRFRSSQASFGNWSKYPTASLAIILQDLLGVPTDQQGPRAVGHSSLDGRLGVTRSGRLAAPGRTEDPPSGLVGAACPLFVTIGQLPSPCLGWFDRPESAGASTMAGWLLGHAPRALRKYPDAGARGPG